MSPTRPTFPMVRFLEGYDAHEVDHAVEMVMSNLALPLPRIGRSDIEELRFTPVRLRPGYDISAVDSWLDEVMAELEQRPAEAEPVAPAPTLTSSEAIVEVAGGSSRWLGVLGVLVVLGLLAYVAFA